MDASAAARAAARAAMPDTPTVTPLVDKGVNIRIDVATAQTLLDWNVLDFTDNRWVIDLDIWRTGKAALRPVEADDAGLIERELREFEGSDALGNGDFSVCYKAADALVSLSSAKVEAEKEVERLRALISPESIEYLADDIAIACVDCRPEIKEARHRAMVRLGERLRKPLKRAVVNAALKGRVVEGEK